MLEKLRRLANALAAPDLAAHERAVIVAQRLAAAGGGQLMHLRCFERAKPAAPLAPSRDSPVAVRLATRADVPALAGVQDAPPATVERRLARGHLAYLALEGGRVIGQIWIHLGPASHGEDAHDVAVYDLAPGVAWEYASEVVPAARRRGVYATMLRAVMADLFTSHPVERVACLIRSGNQASIRAHERLDFASTATLTALSLPGARLAWTTVAGRPGYAAVARVAPIVPMPPP